MKSLLKYILVGLFIFSFEAFSQGCTLSMSSTDVTCETLGTAMVIPGKRCDGPFDYYWEGPNGYTGTSNYLTGLYPGVYYVTVTEATSNTVTGQVVVGLDPTGSYFPIVPETDQNGNSSEVITDICVNQDNGDIFVIGFFTEEIFYNTAYELVNNTEYLAIFVAHYDRCGELQNAKKYGYGDPDECNLHIEILSNGLIAIAGDFIETISFDGGTITYDSEGGSDVFLAILEPTTLLVSSNNNVRHMYSEENDRAKGLTSLGTNVGITGFFNGEEFEWGGIAPLENHNDNYSDLFVGRFEYVTNVLTDVWMENYYFNAPMNWDDRGMATAYVENNNDAYIYFSFKMSYNNYQRSYLARLDAADGSDLGLHQLSQQSGDFHEIMDMKAYGADLYMCGQWYLNSAQQEKHAVVYYYEDPNDNGFTTWTEIAFSSGVGQTFNNVANRMIVNDNGVYLVGSFDQDEFTFSGNFQDPYFHSHFAARLTHADLEQDWLTGIKNGLGTNGLSWGNGFAMENNFGVFYVAGTFNESVELITDGPTLIMQAVMNNDAYIARFVDNGSKADYRRKPVDFIAEIGEIEHIYPNPANDEVFVYTGTNALNSNISFTDMLGRTLYNKNSEINENGYIMVNTSVLPAGTYFVNASNGINHFNYKLIIVK